MSELSYKRTALIGVLCGIVNGLFGAGGGMIAVPMMEMYGVETKKAHAASLFLMLSVSIVSSYVYITNEQANYSELLCLVPAGLAGAAFGCIIMKKINADSLKKLFSCLMIFFGLRIIIK